MAYMIKYKSGKKWFTHNRKWSDVPIKYKTKQGAVNAASKHSFELVYQSNKLKLVPYKNKK